MKRTNLFTGALCSLLLLSCQEKSNTLVLPYIPTIDEVGADALPETIAPLTGIPFEIAQWERPTFPADTLYLFNCGIKADEQIAKVTNQAIQELSAKGGGVVVIPAGEWKSNRIELKSNVNLHLAEGAVVEFSGVAEGYLPAVFTRHEGIDIMGAAAFIYAHKANNIAITGKGKIMGPPMEAEIRQRPNGPSVVEKDIPVDLPIEKRIYDGMNGRTFYRPKTISPIECTNVLIEGVTLERSAQWNIAPVYCENVIIRGVTVHSVEVPSGDGIDIESCKNVLIEYTTLNCGDDCFTLKAGRAEDGLRVGKPTENVVIRYCLAQQGHGGVTLGSETAGGIKNIYTHDCVFEGTRTGIRYKTRRNRGGGTEKSYFERIRMTNVRKAFTWDLLGTPMYMGELAARTPAREPNALTPTIKGIYIKDFIVEGANELFTAHGIPEIPFSDIVIENGVVECKKIITALCDGRDITLRNLSLTCEENEIWILDGANIWFDQVTFTTPHSQLSVVVEGDKSENIRFTGGSVKENEVSYQGISPMVVGLIPTASK